MNYDCSQLTEAVLHIKSQISELDSFVLKRNANEAIEIRKTLNAEINELLAKIDSFKILIRERIAKKYHLQNVENISADCFVGEKAVKAPDGSIIGSVYVFINKNGEQAGEPHDLFIDSGEGTYLVCDLTSGASRYYLLNQSGEIVKNLPEIASLNGNEFSDSCPLPIALGGGKNGFLRPDGEIILQNNAYLGEFDYFSEGLIWIKEDSVNVLYDNHGRVVTRDSRFLNVGYKGISNYSNGFAIGFNTTSSNAFVGEVFLIDRTGNARSIMNIKLRDDFPIIGTMRNFYFIQETLTKYYYDKNGLIHKESSESEKHILIDDLSDDYVYFKKHDDIFTDHYTIYDKNDKLVLVLECYRLNSYQNGFFLITNTEGGYQFIDKAGTPLQKEGTLTHAVPFVDGMARVQDENGTFIIDTKGNDLFHGKRIPKSQYASDLEDGIIMTIETGVARYYDYHGNQVFGY